MNTSTSEALWPSPVAAHEASLHNTDSSQTILMAITASNILDEITTGAFFTTVGVGSASSQDVQYVMALLNQGGYSAHVSGSTLTISW